MKKLTKSGLPLYLDEKNNLMAIEPPAVYAGYGHKTGKDMKGLLYDDSLVKDDEDYYDVYRRILFPENEELLSKYRYQYDITIVMPVETGKECKKTSGHYHAYNPNGIYSPPEVYGVISGTAWYVLQKAKNFDKDPEDLIVEDLIIAEVKAGETIIIPPNYGHCSICVGNEPLVFCNLAYGVLGANSNYYGPVRHYHGLGAYVIKEENRLIVKKNENYKKLPDIRFATVKENPNLGILFDKPVYQSFIENPSAFEFLGNVDEYVDEIMSMLDIKSDNILERGTKDHE